MNNNTEQVFIINHSQEFETKDESELGTGQVNLENIEDFTNVCRTCAAVTEFVVPIFIGEGLQNKLADKIHKYLPIQVSEEDVLPQVVCYQCVSTLISWHDLVQNCTQADTALNNKLSELLQDSTSKIHDRIYEIRTKGDITIKEIKFKVEVDTNELENEASQDTRKEIQNINKPLTITNEEGKKYNHCNICDKNVAFGSWKRHMRAHIGEKRYSCHTCGLAFNDSGNLARHSKAIHAKHRPFSCPVCDKTFTRNGHLRDHMKSHSESREFVCDICGKASKSSAALRMHRKVHQEEWKFSCIKCGAKFKRGGELRAHVTVHTGEKAHSCSCGKSFRLRSQLNSHYKTHGVVKHQLKDSFHESDGCKDIEKRKICEYCGIRQTEEDYPEHVISMHSEDLLPFRERDPFLYVISDDDDQYEDDNPTRKFKQTKTLEKLKTAEPAVKTKVADAGEINKKTGSAKNSPTEKKKRQTNNDQKGAPKPILHIKAATKVKLTRYPLSEFDKELRANVSMASKNSKNKERDKKLAPAAMSAELDAPLEINGPSKQIDNVEIIMACVDKLTVKKKRKPLRCKYCPRVFTAPSSFKYHVKNSHFINETECEICHKKFRNKQVLSQHISQIHEGHKKANICKYCHKSFSTSANLYCHEQNHLDTKKLPCTKCTKTFRWRTHLLRHMKRHSEPNLVCHLCDRRFNVVDDLRRHELTHTEDKQECYRCGKQFSQLRYLRVHMAKKHNETITGN